jgi:ATP synthase subunit 6
MFTKFLYYSPLETFEADDFEWLGIDWDEAITALLVSFFTLYATDFVEELEDTIDEEDDEDWFNDYSNELNDEVFVDNMGDTEDDELWIITGMIFGIVLLGNFVNLIPNNDSNNNLIAFTLFLSAASFLALNLNGILIHSFAMINLFLPQGVPGFLKPLLFVIEVVSYFARLFSLGIRLFANMMSGHILMAILSTFAVILFLNVSFGSFAAFFLVLIITAIYFLETIISYLQAYVFGMLISIYYGDVLSLH